MMNMRKKMKMEMKIYLQMIPNISLSTSSSWLVPESPNSMLAPSPETIA